MYIYNGLLVKLQSSQGFLLYSEQIIHAFLFNIRNYSPEVINIQRRAVIQNISYFCKNWRTTWNLTTTSKSFYIIFVDNFFSNH